MAAQTPPNGEKLALPYANPDLPMLLKRFRTPSGYLGHVLGTFSSMINAGTTKPNDAFTALTNIAAETTPGESLHVTTDIVLMTIFDGARLDRFLSANNRLAIGLDREERTRELLDLSAMKDKLHWTEKKERLEIEAAHGSMTEPEYDIDVPYCDLRVSALEKFQADLRRREEPTTTAQERK